MSIFDPGSARTEVPSQVPRMQRLRKLIPHFTDEELQEYITLIVKAEG